MTPSTFRRDAIERVAMTAVQAAAGAVSGPAIVDALGLSDDLKPVAICIVAAALSWLKALAARRLGRPGSASLDPKV